MKKVMVVGTFDILHLGHIDLFRQAKEHADRLIAVVAQDTRVEGLKGRTPVYTQNERKALLDHITLIDQVVMGNKDDVYAVIQEHAPDVIALGYDQEAFTDVLQDKLDEMNLTTTIVRCEPYKDDIYKSGKLRDALHV